MSERNAVVLVSDDGLLPPAMFAAHRLASLRRSPTTDVILFTSSRAAFEVAETQPLPFAIRPMTLPAWARPLPLFGRPMYFRICIPTLLAGTHRRILYVDVDTYAEDDRLLALLDLDMEGGAVAAVRDWHAAFAGLKAERQAVLGAGGRKYLNSGLLLLDGPQFEGSGMPARIADIVEREGARLRMDDQSALNLLLKEDWLELSPSFNMLPQMWVSFVRRVFDPVLVHFAGIAKPWHGWKFGLAHRARPELEQFLSAPPWKELADRCFPPEVQEARKAGTPQHVRGYDPYFPGKSRLIRNLRETAFADVKQGLTTPHFEHLP